MAAKNKSEDLMVDDLPAAEDVAAEQASSVEKTVEERLLDDPTPFTLENGMEVEIAPLRLREFLKLLRIITKGGMSMLFTQQIDTSDVEQFIAQMIATVVYAIPEAEDETADFLTSVVRVKDLKPTDKNYDEKTIQLHAELYNPSLEDAISIIEMLMRSEGRDLHALGKRLRSLMETAQKIGATKPKK